MNVKEQDSELFEYLIQKVDDTWQVYEYHHIDWSHFIVPLFDVLTPTKANIKAAFYILERFVNSLWEGDGEIGVGWLPGFVSNECDECIGCIFLHVKQGNNGTSFILTNLPLKKYNRNVTQGFK